MPRRSPSLPGAQAPKSWWLTDPATSLHFVYEAYLAGERRGYSTSRNFPEFLCNSRGKVPALSLLWLKSLWHRFNPWLWNFHMLRVQSQNKKKNRNLQRTVLIPVRKEVQTPSNFWRWRVETKCSGNPLGKYARISKNIRGLNESKSLIQKKMLWT